MGGGYQIVATSAAEWCTAQSWRGLGDRPCLTVRYRRLLFVPFLLSPSPCPGVPKVFCICRAGVGLVEPPFYRHFVIESEISLVLPRCLRFAWSE